MSRHRGTEDSPAAETTGAGALPKRETVDEPKAPSEPAQDDIARRAHELYVERGGEPGRDLEDWLRAEAELRRQGA